MVVIPASVAIPIARVKTYFLSLGSVAIIITGPSFVINPNMSYEMRFARLSSLRCMEKTEVDKGERAPAMATVETFLASSVPRGRNGRKIILMAGCLPTTKRFRHGRPDRGR
jgi:hypothetical protein